MECDDDGKSSGSVQKRNLFIGLVVIAAAAYYFTPSLSSVVSKLVHKYIGEHGFALANSSRLPYECRLQRRGHNLSIG